MKSKITAQHVAFAGLVAAVLIAGWYVIDAERVDAPTRQPADAQTSTFDGGELHFSFAYRDTYTLEKREIEVDGVLATYLTLTPKGSVVPVAGEGPTGLTVVVFPNPRGIGLADWLQSMNNTGVMPTSGWDFAEAVVDGKDALAYTSTGLYESDNVAVSHKGAVYVFSGTWLTREDQTLKDLNALIQSVDLK